MDRVSPRSGFSGCLGCKAHDASRSHEEILVKILQHGGYFGIVNHTYLGSRFSFMDISWIYLPPLILNRLDRTFTVCKMRNWCLLPSSPLPSMILMEIPGFVSQPIAPATVGVSIDSIGAEFGGACATSFAGIYSKWCWRIADVLDSKSRIFPFFSSFETGSWEVNHSFESDLCCGDSWLRRSLR